MSSFYSGKFSFNKMMSSNCSLRKENRLGPQSTLWLTLSHWIQFLTSKTEQHFSRHICGIHVTQENLWTPSHLVVPTEILMSPETHHLPEPFADEIILLTSYWGEGSLRSCRWMTTRDLEEPCSGKNGGSTGEPLPSSRPRRSAPL